MDARNAYSGEPEAWPHRPRDAGDHARTVIHEAAPSPRTTSLPPWRVRKVVDHIERHLDQRIRTTELAELAGMSPSHFTRAFRGALNTTPGGFIRRRRIDRAKALLTSSHACLAQIAQDCGFSDQPHFTRVFHDLVGLPPHRWRRDASPAL